MTSRKQCAEFVTYLLENVRDIPLIRIRTLDKKTERNFLHHTKIDHKKGYADARRSGDDLTALYNAMMAVTIETANAYLPLPVSVDSIALLTGVCGKTAARGSDVVAVA
jgi:hypothetical protein